MTLGARSRIPEFLRAFPGGVVRVARDGIVLDSNGRLEEALHAEELIGRAFADALDADSSGGKWAHLLATARGSTCTTWELMLRGGDAIPEPHAFSVIPDEEAGALWLVEHPRDPRADVLRERVTQINTDLANTHRELLRERARLAHALAEQERLTRALQEQNVELERTNATLDEFAHAVSHDLKAPLRSIANASTWIAEDLGEAMLSEDVRAHIALVTGQVGRMRAMVDGLLSYARAGREHDVVERVDVGEVLAEVIALLGPPATGVVEVDGALPTLRAARAPLQQVLQNLIDNAIKHARREDPRVRVSVREVDAAAGPGGDQASRWFEFALADNGPGIPPGRQGSIWGLFHTFGSPDAAESTGVGLAVVRRLIEAQGGRIWVESDEGSGATFRFLWRESPSVQRGDS